MLTDFKFRKNKICHYFSFKTDADLVFLTISDYAL